MILTPHHIQSLHQHSLFSALDEEQLAHALNHAAVIQLKPGEHLFHAGQQAEAFYYVVEGQVKLYRLSPAGAEKVIEIIRPTQTFAEALMFMDVQAYPVEAQSLGKTELVAIHTSNYLEILSSSTQTSFRVMADLSMRLKQRLHEIDALTLQNATLRVINYLLYLLPEDCDRNDSAGITLPAAKNIIASRLSVQPETLSRIFSTLGTEGLIRVDGLNVQILDLTALREYCNQE